MCGISRKQVLIYENLLFLRKIHDLILGNFLVFCFSIEFGNLEKPYFSQKVVQQKAF